MQTGLAAAADGQRDSDLRCPHRCGYSMRRKECTGKRARSAISPQTGLGAKPLVRVRLHLSHTAAIAVSHFEATAAESCEWTLALA